jgi:RNA polymerase sigma factor (sigma-70 family)
MPVVHTTLGGFLQQLKQSMAAESLAALSDQDLVERFLASYDEAAFQAILRRHGPMVFRVCRRTLHNEQDVEDAFQATFLVLARRARTIQKRGSLASWLHGVAYRAALKARARIARRREREATAEEGAERASLPEDIGWKELRSLLDEELLRLPEKLRAPLVLCYLEGLTQDEAALRLGWSKSTCRRKLECGRELLGARLARRGVTLSAILLAPLLSECTAVAALPPELLAATAKGLVALAAGKVEGALSGSTTLVSDRAVALAEGLQPVGLAWQWKLLGTLAVAVLLAGFGGALVFWAPQNSRREAPLPALASEPVQVVTNDPAPDREVEPRDAPAKLESKLPSLILDRKVQAELHLTDDQVRKIRDAVQEVQSRHKDAPDTPRGGRLTPVPVPARPSGPPDSFPTLREGTAEQELQRFAAYRANLKIEAEKVQVLREVLPGLLTPDQVRRFRQVELQAAGLGAFAEPTVEQALALTGEQKARIRALAQEPDEAFQLSTTPAVPDLMQTRKVPLVLDLLTEEQRRTWSELSGPPFQHLPLAANGDLLLHMRRAYMSQIETPKGGEPGQILDDRLRKALRPER